MEKLQCGLLQGRGGLVVPRGYTFNTDGSSIYMTLARCSYAQATKHSMTLMQQLTLMAVAV